MDILKKLVLFLFVLCSMTIVFAENPYVYSGSGSIDGKASAKVFVNTKGTELCRVGFSTEKPSDYDNAPVSVDTNGIKLEISAQDGTASTSNNFYLYYQIKSGADIKVSMYGDKQLSGTENNADKVKWYVTVEEEDSSKTLSIDGSEKENDGETEGRKLLIHSHLPSPSDNTQAESGWSSTTYGSYGGYEISINTGDDSLWDKKADEYSATLYVVIEAEGENAPKA